ncbi:MAG TPA: potassium transporter Kef, partial [Candidatus Nanopelagicales bacterium]|nr:potassium transporter Kef [Candidatus Nanopelagicales bacterium]
GHLVEDLLEPAHGLEIVERDITPAELGKAPADLRRYHEVVLTVVRDGMAHRFDQDVITVLQNGDRVVVVRPVREQA